MGCPLPVSCAPPHTGAHFSAEVLDFTPVYGDVPSLEELVLIFLGDSLLTGQCAGGRQLNAYMPAVL